MLKKDEMQGKKSRPPEAYGLIRREGSDELDDAVRFLKHVVATIKDGGMLYLYGEIGAGKTTLVKQIAETFGLDPVKIKSPTYTYYRKYTLAPDQDFYHFDLYRLEHPDDKLLGEITEILQNPKNILAIEWPNQLAAHLPAAKLTIKIEIKDNERNFLLL